VQNHVSPYFADVVWKGISTRYVRMGLNGTSPSKTCAVSGCLSVRGPTQKNWRERQKSLLVHALYDYSFPPDLSRQVLRDYRELNLPHNTFALRCGHYTSGCFPSMWSWVCHVQVSAQKPLNTVARALWGYFQVPAVPGQTNVKPECHAVPRIRRGRDGYSGFCNVLCLKAFSGPCYRK